MKLASIAWRLALAVLLIMLTWQAYQLRNLPIWMEQQIRREAADTRAVALMAIDSTGKRLDDRLAGIQGQLFHEVAAIFQLPTSPR